MIKNWILKRLDAVPRRQFVSMDPAGSDLVRKLISENKRLTAELLGKEDRLRRNKRVISTNIGDAEPSDEKARADYVASASNFYTDILENKILQMIAQVREELDTEFIADLPLGLNRYGYDNFLRGTSNAFKLLMDWGEQMKGEHLSNISHTTNE